MTIRPVRPSDAPEIAALLGELGYPTTMSEALARLESLTSAPGHVLIAETEDALLGLIAVAWQPMLHLAHPIARVTTLVIAEGARRTGVGRQLLALATEHARAAGCGEIEVTTSMKRTDAHAFYQAEGFALNSYRLHKKI